MGEAKVTTSDALEFTVEWMRQGDRSRCSSYGYDVYITNVIEAYLEDTGVPEHQREGKIPETSGPFLDAAWELCRRGILRPGVRVIGAQATDQGNGGSGFSVTPFGRLWLEEAQGDIFVPTEPERFGQLLVPYAAKFGLGFASRAQEAVRCYGAHAYLACCAMSGAAAESILLATLIAKTKDAAQVLKTYATASGRARLEAQLLGQAKEHLVRGVRSINDLLKYWRDEAAHGRPSEILDNEAFTSLALLLRAAQFVSANWADLVEEHS